MAKQYRSATMHQVTFAPGVGNISKELSTSGDAVHKAVESIELAEGSNIVTVVFKDTVGKKVAIDIPLSNFANLRE